MTAVAMALSDSLLHQRLGSAIGVAVLVALLADPAPAELFSRLQRGWAFALGAGIATAGLAMAIGQVRMRAREPAADQPTLAPALADGGEVAIAIQERGS
jgi:hypothetical protein